MVVLTLTPYSKIKTFCTVFIWTIKLITTFDNWPVLQKVFENRHSNRPFVSYVMLLSSPR